MQDQESLQKPTNWADDVPRKQLSPYELLLQQSRKLGMAATRTYDVTREFLKQDVSTLGQAPFLTLKPVNSAKPSLKRLNKIVAQSHEILAAAQTVILPNNLFPDSVVVDRTKVTITRRTFFWSADVISIRIKDILNVSTSVGPLFGSLTISSRVMNSTDHYQINHFWRHDAIHLKHIIQGYAFAVHDDIDMSHLPREKLIEKLIELGHDKTA